MDFYQLLTATTIITNEVACLLWRLNNGKREKFKTRFLYIPHYDCSKKTPKSHHNIFWAIFTSERESSIVCTMMMTRPEERIQNINKCDTCNKVFLALALNIKKCASGVI